MMKKLVLGVVAAMFSMSAAAYACDGVKGAHKGDKASQTAKAEKKDDKKS